MSRQSTAHGYDNDLLDVIVRMHDPNRLEELSRCLFSLVCQTHHPIRINVCTQRFSLRDRETLSRNVQGLVELDPDIKWSFLNYERELPKDSRSALLNFGLSNTDGRFVAFLNYDDVIFPNAYRMLIEELEGGEAAIAFGGIQIKHVKVHRRFVYVENKGIPFKGNDQIDLFRENFCPIHSYVMDRKKIAPNDLFTEPMLTRNEDYDLLLRMCATYPSSFKHKNKLIGDYYDKDDGGNAAMIKASENDENHKTWTISRQFLEARRDITFVSPAVQKQLGFVETDPNMTIRKLLESRKAS